MFYAHSSPRRDEAEWQALLAHLTEVSRRAAELARPLGLSRAAALAGLVHDLGKYDPDFQAYPRGRGTSVDHSAAGAAVLLDQAAPRDRIAAEALAYCILGHHAGLPDRVGGPASLEERIEGFARGRLGTLPTSASPPGRDARAHPCDDGPTPRGERLGGEARGTGERRSVASPSSRHRRGAARLT